MRMHFFGGKTPEKRMKSHSYTCLVKREMCPKETKGDFFKGCHSLPPFHKILIRPMTSQLIFFSYSMQWKRKTFYLLHYTIKLTLLETTPSTSRQCNHFLSWIGGNDLCEMPICLRFQSLQKSKYYCLNEFP